MVFGLLRTDQCYTRLSQLLLNTSSGIHFGPPMPKTKGLGTGTFWISRMHSGSWISRYVDWVYKELLKSTEELQRMAFSGLLNRTHIRRPNDFRLSYEVKPLYDSICHL